MQIAVARFGDRTILATAGKLYASSDGASWTELPARGLPADIDPAPLACKDELLVVDRGSGNIYVASGL